MSEVEMPAEGEYPSGLSNYYGEAILAIKDGVAVIYLENHCGPDSVQVTAEFAAAWVKQFGTTT